ncbi:conserved hypothetical protein [Burkholderia vietnamiensis]|nr:conserved hypothetical protein [Burkholderia vietnamiensis]
MYVTQDSIARSAGDRVRDCLVVTSSRAAIDPAPPFDSSASDHSKAANNRIARCLILPRTGNATPAMAMPAHDPYILSRPAHAIRCALAAAAGPASRFVFV